MLVILALTLGGCKATPPTVEDRGINRAMSDAEVAASETVSGGLLPFEEIKAQNGRVIDSVLYGEDRTALAVKARVTVAQVDEVPLLALKDANLDIEFLKRVFFGDRAEEAIDQTSIYKGQGTMQWELPAEPGQRHGAILILTPYKEGLRADLTYAIDDGAILYDDFPDDDILPYLEDVPTPDEAVCAALLDEKLAQLELGIQGHSLSLESPTNTDKKTGSYNFRYLPDYGVLPGVADYAIRTVIGGAATFSVKGMTQLILKNPKTPEAAGVVEEMLGIDQALDIVRAHLGKGLNPRQDKAVEEITLSYRYVQDGVTGEVSAYPVWLFYMEPDPPLTGDYGGSIGEKVEYERRDECFIVDVSSGVVEVITTSRVEVK